MESLLAFTAGLRGKVNIPVELERESRPFVVHKESKMLWLLAVTFQIYDFVDKRNRERERTERRTKKKKSPSQRSLSIQLWKFVDLWRP